LLQAVLCERQTASLPMGMSQEIVLA
jgi:hypothetical protein